MIIHATTATVKSGKFAQMREWAQKVTSMVQESHGIEVTVLRNVAGSGDEWHFMSTHDSLAAVEAYTDALNADPQFMALVADATANELWRATRNSIFRSAF